VVTKVKKPRWRFRILKRQTLQELVVRFTKRTTDEDASTLPKEHCALPPTAPKQRRRRRPNMATTQRKLAASKKRLKKHNPPKSPTSSSEQPEEANGRTPRRVTELSEEGKPSPVANRVQIGLSASSSTVRRTPMQPELIMRHQRGSASIEVEFIDDSDSPSIDPVLWRSKTTPESIPISFTTASMEKEGEIGVEWKPVGGPLVSREETRSVTPSKYYSVASELGSSMHSSTHGRRVHGKSTLSSDCGSASGSSDVVMEAWTEYRRDRVIEKLAGLKIQQPVESQCFEAKKALKIHPPGQETCMMIAYPSDQECKAPEWIKNWNSSFRSLSSSRISDGTSDETHNENSLGTRVPKPDGEFHISCTT